MRSLIKSAAFNPVRLNAVDVETRHRIRGAALKFASKLTMELAQGTELDILIEMIENVSMRAVKTLSEQARERYGA